MTSLRKRQPTVEFLHLLRDVLLPKQIQPRQNQTVAMSRFPKRQSFWMTPRIGVFIWFHISLLLCTNSGKSHPNSQVTHRHTRTRTEQRSITQSRFLYPDIMKPPRKIKNFLENDVSIPKRNATSAKR